MGDTEAGKEQQIKIQNAESCLKGLKMECNKRIKKVEKF